MVQIRRPRSDRDPLERGEVERGVHPVLQHVRGRAARVSRGGGRPTNCSSAGVNTRETWTDSLVAAMSQWRISPRNFQVTFARNL